MAPPFWCSPSRPALRGWLTRLRLDAKTISCLGGIAQKVVCHSKEYSLPLTQRQKASKRLTYNLKLTFLATCINLPSAIVLSNFYPQTTTGANMATEESNNMPSLCNVILQGVMDHFLHPLHKFAAVHPQYITKIPGFLVSPQAIKIYVGRTHVAIEYSGPEVVEELPEDGKAVIDIYYHDMSLKDINILEEIIGFDCESDSTTKIQLPLSSIIENGIFFTNRGFDKLQELGWNFAAQSSVVGFNAFSPSFMPKEFVRIINTSFFNSEPKVGLQTRHIKWLDAIPVEFDPSDDEYDSFEIPFNLLFESLKHAATYIYPMPDGYKNSKLSKINKFIEFWGDELKSETDITRFLSSSDNSFILTMRFCSQDVYPELECIWQSEKRKNIRPDFFLLIPMDILTY